MRLNVGVCVVHASDDLGEVLGLPNMLSPDAQPLDAPLDDSVSTGAIHTRFVCHLKNFSQSGSLVDETSIS